MVMRKCFRLSHLSKQSLQRLLMSIEWAGRRVSGEVLQENAPEMGKAEKQYSRWWSTTASGKRVEKAGLCGQNIENYPKIHCWKVLLIIQWMLNFYYEYIFEKKHEKQSAHESISGIWILVRSKIHFISCWQVMRSQLVDIDLYNPIATKVGGWSTSCPSGYPSKAPKA